MLFIKRGTRSVASTFSRSLKQQQQRQQRSFGLLKGLNPILTADLLSALREAGHGDEIAVVDVNFPAVSTAEATMGERLVTLTGVDAVEATDAICSVCPVDAFVDVPCVYMGPNEGDSYPDAAQEVHTLFKDTIGVRYGLFLSVAMLHLLVAVQLSDLCFRPLASRLRVGAMPVEIHYCHWMAENLRTK